MRVDSINIQNFRGIERMALLFDPHLNVFVGVNGIGKSTILDAITIMLSWFLAKIFKKNGQGHAIRELDIGNGILAGAVGAIVLYRETPFSWVLAKNIKKQKNQYLITSLTELNHFIEIFQADLAEADNITNVPVIICYPVNRSVLDIPLKIRKKHEFSLLETYDQSLTSAANFRTFFEWFRNREDLENEIRLSSTEGTGYRDRQLEAVRNAIAGMVDGFSGLSVRRNPLRMVVRKNGQELWVNQLSDGEKCMIAMVGDLARRLAIANPVGDNPLEGEGIVLIDEIDLHLHPQWQRRIIPGLRQTFPNCQFIVSTHSPPILSQIDPRHIWLLERDEESGKIVARKPEQTLGLDSCEILEEIMGTPRRDDEVSRKLTEISRFIDNDEFEKAREQIAALKELVHGSLPDIVGAETMMKMLEADGETPEASE